MVTLLRVLQYYSECRDDGTSTESTKDGQLQTLAEVTAEFLADICSHISKVILPKFLLDHIIYCQMQLKQNFSTEAVSCFSQDTVADLVEKGFLTEKACLTAAGSLLPNFRSSVSYFYCNDCSRLRLCINSFTVRYFYTQIQHNLKGY